MNYLIKPKLRHKHILFVLTIVSFLGFLTEIQAQYYIGGYIRRDRLETAQISSDILKKHTDLMVLGFHPKSDGHLQKVDHQAVFSNGVNYMNAFDGRSGVVSFTGQAGATLNGQADLLVNNKTFTFSTWVYLNSQSTYIPGKFVFKKVDANREVSLRVGGNYGQLIFRVVDNGVTYSATANATETGILPNEWNHLAITFNGAAGQGNQVKLYVNGQAIVMNTTSVFPVALPITNSNFILGENFSGYLDEVLVNDLTLNPSDITQFYSGNYPFNTFNHTKTVAFWNFDDQNNPGKDLRSHAVLFDRIKSMIAGTNIKLYLTISGGEWQTAISTDLGRTNFANDINSILINQNLDGVDVDLEWPASNTDAGFAHYNAFVLKLREVIGSSKKLSLSLHPGYYKASMNAIQASDYVALQMYGPRATWWSYDKYVEAAQAALAYGIPKNKLVMGLPFFATTGVSGEQIGYRDIIAVNPNLDFDIDEILFNNKNYTFNGVTTIQKKAEYVCMNDLAGIMAWDIPLDMLDYNSSHSLLKAAITGLNSCGSATITSLDASFVSNTLVVNWTINKAQKLDYFLVEWSADNKTFNRLDSVSVIPNDGVSEGTLSYTSIQMLDQLYSQTRQLGDSVVYSILFVVICIPVYKKRKMVAKDFLFFSIAMVLLSVGCSKQINKELEVNDKPKYVRVVMVDILGEKSYSSVIDIL